MSTFNGRAENIENNLNKVKTINPAVTDNQYPSAKAVYDFAKKDTTYDPKSENAQTGKAVAQAISHFDTILKQGNTFIFDGGRPSGKIDIDLVVDDGLDPQSQNPLQNDVIAQKIASMQQQTLINLGEIQNLKTENQNQSQSISELEQLVAQKVAEIYSTLQVEEGSNEGWDYIKFPNGSFIAWGEFTYTPSPTSEGTAAGGGLYYSVPFEVALPFAPLPKPYPIVSATISRNSWAINAVVTNENPKLYVRVMKVGKINESTNYPIRLQVTGRWK